MENRIVLATENQVKANAVRIAFDKMFNHVPWEVETVAMPSGVSEQPMSDEETFKGAMNRARAARDTDPGADFWVGIEGGLMDYVVGVGYFAWSVIMTDDFCGKGRSGTFLLPDPVQDLIRQGKSLSEADKVVFKRDTASKMNGIVGLLTGDVITRTEFYVPSLIYALIPFKNKEIY